MRLLGVAAVAGGLVIGSLGLGGGAVASPLVAPGLSGIESRGGLVEQAWHRGRPHYQGRRYYGRRFYGPRTVCRTRLRTVRTRYGDLVRRPVRVCTRVY